MAAVKTFADAGGPVLGICNGFQVLLEAGLLPGAMLRNRSVQFVCEHVIVKVEQTDTPFTLAAVPARRFAFQLPTARATITPTRRRCPPREKSPGGLPVYEAEGVATDDSNPNGSVANIAGLCNEQRNVVGLMPHPERACELALGSADGLIVFESALKAMTQGAFAAAR